ncbi:MAG: choice-of-anchor B family protein [Gemmatimonadota bacterium]
MKSRDGVRSFSRILLWAGALGVCAAPLSAQSHRSAGPSASTTAAAPGRLTGFSAAIAISGDEIFVGRPGELSFFPMPASRVGGVHVFRRAASAGGWKEAQVLSAGDLEISDGFGQVIAADGDLLLVGAPDQRDARGAVYVFERGASGSWTLAHRLQASDGASGDSLGFAVAVRGNLALLGAPGHGDGGLVYVLRRDPGTGAWSRVTTLAAPEAEATGARFGAALALGEGRALVGAPGPHPAPPLFGRPPSPAPGAAYVFREDASGTAWRQEAKLEVGEGEAFSLGAAVVLGSEEALVAAPMTGRGTGAVYEFRRDAGTGSWSRVAKLVPANARPGSLFGVALARAGEDLLVGAPISGGLAGAVHVFHREGETGPWRDAQTLTVQKSGFATALGMAIAAQGDLAVAGAPGADFFEGIGYLFARGPDTGKWAPAGSIVNAPAGLDPIVGGQVECRDGSADQFDCKDVDLVSFLPVRALGGQRGIMVNDLWGWTDPETGREYALVGRFDGTAFVDLSDPARPVYLGDLPLTEGATPNLWRDIKVYRNHAYIVADAAGAHGVQIFDLTQLRDVQNPPVTFHETAHYDGIHSAHNIVIDEESGFAFTVGNSMGGETCGGGLHMIDIREPEHPRFAGCFADPTTGNAKTGYTHDAMCTVYHGPDADYRGHEICFNSSETALGIADVTNKRHPVALAAASYPNVGYAHQGWLTEDQRYFLMDDEEDELQNGIPRTRTLVWDVQDLEDPILVKEYLGTTPASDHNLYIKGRYAYESNYVSGLRILDISDPTDPVEVGHFDTMPWGEDAPGFAGSWSNYPFFHSGLIIVSSMKEGLFILKKREPRTVS